MDILSEMASSDSLTSYTQHCNPPQQHLTHSLPFYHAPPQKQTAIKHVVMDIEGTTTSISFVHETLFPYAAQTVEAHLRCERCYIQFMCVY